MKNTIFWFLKLIGVVSLTWVTLCQGASLDYMAPKHDEEVQAWLRIHTEFRLATIDDCRCMDSVLTLRKGDGPAWKPQPAYQPYYAVADFNRDGIKDFAVVVRPLANESGSKVLVFLGGQPKQMASPIVFPIKDKSLENIGLFLARPISKNSRLLLGTFGSEAEELQIPKARNP